MARTGIQRKSRTEQSLNGELRLIINEFSRAMWNADRSYVSAPSACPHDSGIHFTLNMVEAWGKYIDFCKRYPIEE